MHGDAEKRALLMFSAGMATPICTHMLSYKTIIGQILHAGYSLNILE